MVEREKVTPQTILVRQVPSLCFIAPARRSYMFIGVLRDLEDYWYSYNFNRHCRSALQARWINNEGMPNNLHGRDLRKGRYSIPGQIYLVTVVTCNRRLIFSDFNIGRIVIRELMQADNFGSTRTQAFVVMPDHFHWLVELGDRLSLSSVVANVKCHSARVINQCFVATGTPIWQRGFHDHALRNDQSVIDAARYIIANPLRSGLVKRVGDYPLWDAVWL